MKIVRWRAD